MEGQLSMFETSKERFHIGGKPIRLIELFAGVGSQAMALEELGVEYVTPRECWRLMDFKDEDFEKAEQVCSNTQLYKQAGNSIVKKCLVEIFRNLL